MIGLLFLLASAHAQVEVCTEPYSRIQLGAAIGDVSDAYADRDLDTAKTELNEIGERIVCLDEVVDRALIAKFTRFMAINYFFEQDDVSAVRWGRASRHADATLSWDEREFPPDHPLRLLLDGLDPAAPVQDATHGLDVPRGGGVFASGILLVLPDGIADTPTLVQVFDGDRELVGAYWQDGVVFREWVLSDKRKEVAPPRWWSGDGPSSFSDLSGAPQATLSASRGDGLPLVPIVVSGGLLLTSGIAYALAGAAAGSLADQTSSEDLTKVRSRANMLVVLSGAALAAGVGVGVGGVLVDGGAGARFTLRF